jgi:cytochrome c-type biogenesis protein CcmE
VEPIEYQSTPPFVLKFSVEDPKDPKGSIPVVYQGLKPDMFAAGRDVLIDGDYRSGVVQAAKLQTQCPSKYEPASPESQLQGQKASQQDARADSY